MVKISTVHILPLSLERCEEKGQGTVQSSDLLTFPGENH